LAITWKRSSECATDRLRWILSLASSANWVREKWQVFDARYEVTSHNYLNANHRREVRRATAEAGIAAKVANKDDQPSSEIN
jgi:hypothetical protein